MALNTFKCNCLTPLQFKGLKRNNQLSCTYLYLLTCAFDTWFEKKYRRSVEN